MPKILIFHDSASSPKVAYGQTYNLRSKLERNGFTMEYVQGPLQLASEGSPWPSDEDTVKPLFAWWSPESPSPKEALDLITQKYYNDHCVIGCIGLSQGGSLATLVAANYLTVVPSLKFGVSFGGYLYSQPGDEQVDVYLNHIPLPFLNVYAENDDHVEMNASRRLTEFGENVTEIVHAKGYTFGDDDGECVGGLVKWIKGLY